VIGFPSRRPKLSDLAWLGAAGERGQQT